MIIFLLLLSLTLLAFLSTVETAFFSLSSLKIQSYREDKDRRKQLIAQMVAQPRFLLVAMIIVNVAVNIAIQNLFSSLFGEESSWWYKIVIPLGLILFIGEIIPKSIGFVHNATIAYRSAPLVQSLLYLFTPIGAYIVKIVEFFSRFLFFLKKEEELSLKELQHALKISREKKIVDEEEATLMEGYLLLQQLSAQERMRDRSQILFFTLEEPLSRLVHLFADKGVLYLPICEKERGIDGILGILSRYSFFLYQESIANVETLLSILKKPFFVPETVSSKTLLEQLYLHKEQLAILVDEHSAVSGMITRKELAQIMISVPTNYLESNPLYNRSGKDVIIAQGRMEVSEIERVFDLPFNPKKNSITVGGYVTELMERIPKSGEQHLTPHYLFHILSAGPSQVDLVYIRRIRETR